jgi:hypothetical protein
MKDEKLARPNKRKRVLHISRPEAQYSHHSMNKNLYIQSTGLQAQPKWTVPGKHLGYRCIKIYW